MSERQPGDPEGRRLARVRAASLSEAGRVAVALRALIERAGLPTDLCDELINTITQNEQRELLKAEGRIESRKRFKVPTSHPLHAGRDPDFLFVDESGRPDARFPSPVFALGAVAMTAAAVDDYCLRADALKQAFFGRTDLTLHEPEMRRHEEIYSFGGDVKRRSAFCEAVDTLVEETEFVAFGVAIRKPEFAAFMDGGSDRYLPVNVYPVTNPYVNGALRRLLDCDPP